MSRIYIEKILFILSISKIQDQTLTNYLKYIVFIVISLSDERVKIKKIELVSKQTSKLREIKQKFIFLYNNKILSMFLV